ncbi:MAG: UPF0149 family protein [Francisellaceae bacterium]
MMNEKKLDRLDDLLLDLYGEESTAEIEEGLKDEHIFSVSMLDGYLTAVLLASFEVPTENWIEGVWREDEAPLLSAAEKETLIAEIGDYYQHLKQTLNKQLVEFEPLVYYTEFKGQTFAQIDLWLDGFERGFEYFEQYWRLTQPIEELVDQILAFDDETNFDDLSAVARDKAVSRLSQLVIELYQVSRSDLP